MSLWAMRRWRGWREVTECMCGTSWAARRKLLSDQRRLTDCWHRNTVRGCTGTVDRISESWPVWWTQWQKFFNTVRTRVMPVENWKTHFKVFFTVPIDYQYKQTNKQNCRPTSVAVTWLSRSVAGTHGRSLLSPRTHPDKSMCVLWNTNCHRGTCDTRFCGLFRTVSFQLN